jgi:two-component system nitrogen regulation sensor histidine kinase NtrY
MARTAAERKRILELVAIVVTTALLVLLSRLETRLVGLGETLSRDPNFFKTVIYFGQINAAIILILLLSFLLIRNVAKLVVERRRGVLGSKLRVKLVAALMFFALVPTILYFYVSARFVINSFDEWMSDNLRTIMHDTREAGDRIYNQDQRRLESLARIALQRIKVLGPDEVIIADEQPIVPNGLDGFETQYGLDEVKVFDRQGRLLWTSNKAHAAGGPAEPFVIEAIARFVEEPGLLSMRAQSAEDQQDVVKGIAPISRPGTTDVLGVVVTETRFETQILKSIEAIQQSFSSLRPSAQLIKLNFLIMLVLMTMLIGFSAVWLGFYVARGITGPIQALAEGTREVALGNYNIALTPKAEDETGQLTRSFNLMTKDLQRHRTQAEEARVALLHSNEELEQRRRYMEVILKNITAGVIAVAPDGLVTAVNHAAEELLKIEARRLIGRKVMDGLDAALHKALWAPVEEGLQGGQDAFGAQLDVVAGGRTLTLLVEATRIHDEGGEDLGVVLVFDDATEQVKIQRVAAWREVARRIAHEIKNPVTPIKLSAQRLLRRFHGKFEGEEREVFEQCLDTILKQVDSLRDLVNEFSKFSRLPQVRPKMGNINDVILDVANLYRMSYPQVALDTSGLAALPEFPLDKDQMNRVFVNLVSNALAALDQEAGAGRIEFRTMVLRNLDTVRVEVVDNGCGIPPHLRDRVLEPYYSTKDGGTGLGLAIVNQIIADHGGYLRILGNEPRGTKVVIELPMGADQVRRA